MNFYKHYLGDYARDTADLSLAEHGAYRLMLDHYYATERPLPADKMGLCRICKAFTPLERAAIDAIARRFFFTDGELLRNKRADEEIAQRLHQITVNRELGKRGGRPKLTQSITDSVIGSVTDSETDSRTQPKANRNPLQIKLNPKPLNPSPEDNGKGKGRGEKATRLPPDWRPAPGLLAWAKSDRPDLDLERVVESFRDHWHSKPGKDATKLDWRATFRNWVRAEKRITNAPKAKAKPWEGAI